MRFHTTFRLHQRALKVGWYRIWHDFRYAHHFHIAMLMVYLLAVVAGSFGVGTNPNGAYAASSSWSQPATTAFAGNGTYSNTQESAGTVKLSSGAASLSNANSGIWQNKRPVTVTNGSGGALSDYQLQVNPFADSGFVNNNNQISSWHFNEGSGTSIADSSGNNNVGTIGGSSYWGTNSRFGNGFLGNGTSNYVSLPDSNSWTLGTGNFSLDFWVKLNEANPSTRKPIITSSTGGLTSDSDTFGLFQSPSGKWEMTFYSTNKTWTSSTASDTSKWQHISIVRPTGVNDVYLYVNGVQLTGAVASGSWNVSSYNINWPGVQIGRGWEGTYFNGQLDELKIYNRALSGPATDCVADSSSEVCQRYGTAGVPKIRGDYQDLRFAKADGTELPHWQETDSKYWVKYTGTLPTGNSMVDIYYGNPVATSSSNGSNVFDFFDNFNSYTVGNLAGQGSWSETGPTNTVSAAKSKSGNSYRHLYTSGNAYKTFPAQTTAFVAEWDQFHAAANAGLSFDNQSSVNSYDGAWVTTFSGTGKLLYYSDAGDQPLLNYSLNKWYGIKAIINPVSQNIKVSVDGSAALYDGDMRGNITSFTTIHVPVYTSGPDTYFDNIRIRKYASVEPTYSMGAESGVYYTGAGASYVSPALAPTGLYGNWGDLTVNATLNSQTMSIDILDGVTGNTFGFPTTTLTTTPQTISLASIATASRPSIKIRANMSTNNAGVGPVLNSWSISYSYDVTAPSVPSGFTVTPLTGSTASLNWNVSTDTESGANPNESTIRYDVQRAIDNNGVPSAWGDAAGTCSDASLITAVNSCTDSGLTANTKYYYKVRARDAAGNYSISAGGSSGNTEIQPNITTGKDNQLNSTNSTTNYGTSTAFYIGELNSQTDMKTRALLGFNLAGNIPAGKQITSATLSIYPYQDFSNNAATYSVYRLKKSWTEAGSTWNKYDSTNNWESAGGFGGTDVDQAAIGSKSFGASETLNEYKNFILDPAAVQEMYSGSFADNGFMIKSSGEVDDAFAFVSSEYATQLSTQLPKLVVTWNDFVSTTTLPNTPSLSAPTLNQKTTRPTFVGTGATPGSIVRLYDGAVHKASVFADGSGNFTFDESTAGYIDFAVGLHESITVRGYNDSGETAGSGPRSVLIDIEAPGSIAAQDILQSKIGASDGSDIVNNEWGNAVTVYFSWSAIADNPPLPAVNAGVKNYYVYFGPDADAIPRLVGQETADSTASATKTIDSPVSGTSYYLRIQAKDNAGNISPDNAVSTLFTYNFDNTAPAAISYVTPSPAGWSATNSFTFNWPAATDIISNSGSSDVKGYLYRRKTVSNQDNWEEWDENSRFVSQGSGTIQLSAVEAMYTGVNVLQVRTLDNAGNMSVVMPVNYYYSGDIPKPQNLSVNLSESSNQTVNRYSFSWDKPTGVEPQGYYYSVNAEPDTQNATFIPYGGSGNTTTTGFSAFATKVGLNKFYVVTKASDNVGWTNYEMREFTCNTAAPGIPTSVMITDSSNRDSERWQLTVNWDQPTEITNDFSGYSIERSTDSVNYAEIATSASQTTGYLDTNLLNSVTYSYRVRAKDNTGNKSAASSVVLRQPTGRYTEPPKMVEDPSVEIQATKAKITFVTDRDADSFVQIGTTTEYGMTQGQLDSTSIHEVNLSGLTPGTFYHYRAMWRDIDSNIGYSKDYTFKTQDAPGISEVIVSNIGLNSAIVSWKTTTVSSSIVYYGKTNTYGNQIEDKSGSGTTTHVVKLDSLTDSTAYHFKISGTDVDGNPLISDDYIFETLTFPRTSGLTIVQKPDEAMSTIVVSWTTNVPTDTVVNYSGKEASKALLETRHSITIGNLKDNTTYNISVSGRDAYGNQAESSATSYKTPFDSRPPIISSVTTETSIVGYGTDAKSQVIVSWETDEPASSQVEYAVGVSGAEYSQKTQEDSILTTSHVVVISGLKPSTSYHFRVISRDNALNRGVSDDSSLLTDQASASVLDIIINSLQSTIGWIFGSFR